MANLFQSHIDLEDNEHREIDNPLAHIEDLNQLDEDARQFARRVNPEAPDFRLWEKAARVARDPLGSSCESVPNLTKQEENVLKKERSKGFWSQPKTLRVTIVTLCLGTNTTFPFLTRTSILINSIYLKYNVSSIDF